MRGIDLAGHILSELLGGCDATLLTLLLFMAVEYISEAVAVKFFRVTERKAEKGTWFQRLCRKGMILLVVILSARLDLMMKSQMIRDTAMILFIANEARSILEHAVQMGVPVPPFLERMIRFIKGESGGKG